MRPLGALVGLLGLASVAGCAGHMNEEIRRDRLLSRAPFDLACERPEIELTSLESAVERGIEWTTYGAAGCGRRATYRLRNCGNGYLQTSCRIELESDPRSP